MLKVEAEVFGQGRHGGPEFQVQERHRSLNSKPYNLNPWESEQDQIQLSKARKLRSISDRACAE